MKLTPNQGQSSILTGKVCLHVNADPSVQRSCTEVVPQADAAPGAGSRAGNEKETSGFGGCVPPTRHLPREAEFNRDKHTHIHVRTHMACSKISDCGN